MKPLFRKCSKNLTSDYSKAIDQKPSDDTRQAVAKNPYCTDLYVRDVDQKPSSDDTRRATGKDLNMIVITLKM